MEIEAPGLKWRTRSDGTKVAYWVCSSHKMHANFQPRTVRIWHGKDSPTEHDLERIVSTCARMQMEMVEFAMNPRRNHRPDRRPGCIYFIRSGNLVKIGYTAGNPEVRLKKLQIGSPTKLTLAGTIEGDNVIERQLHWRFKSQHSHGEWFFFEGALKRYITKLFAEDFSPEQVANEA